MSGLKTQKLISMSTTNVTTGRVRLSYANLFEPKALNEGQEPKYSVSIIIPKSDTKTIEAIEAAVEAAKVAGKAKLEVKGKLPTNIKSPLRDGDIDRPDDPAYADSYFINCSSLRKPQIVERIDGVFHAITDKARVYSGCYARVSMNMYAFAVQGNKGIAAGLNNVCFLADGEPLGAVTSVESDFGDDFEDDDLLS